MSDEIINSVQTLDYGITPYLSYYNTNTIRVEFDGGCLKQEQGTLLHGGKVNLSIVYEIDNKFNISSYLRQENCLLGVVKLTKNADIDKYGYSGYGIRFDRHGRFSFSGTRLGRNVIIFEVDMSSSRIIDNKKKHILSLWRGPTQELERTLSAERMYLINFTELRVASNI